MSEAWDDLREDYNEFKSEWYKYASSGVCDTEGRWAVQDYLIASLKGEKPFVSFTYLQGYSTHAPDDKCPYTKTEVAANVRRALSKLSTKFKRVYKKKGNGRTPYEFVSQLIG